MRGKSWQGILPLPFVSAFITAIVFLLVVAGALLYVKQHEIPGTLIEHFLAKPFTAASLYNNEEIIGFLPSWNIEKQPKIDTANLTQIIYSGLGVNDKGEIIQINEQGKPTSEWQNFKSDYLTALRKQAAKTHTKVLVSIKNFDNNNIDTLISSPYLSDTFMTQLIKIVKDNQIDGVNIDFEYFTDSTFPTFKHLNQFFTTLNTRLKKENPDLVLSADFTASAISHDPAYDMVKLGQELDQIILMGYDYSTADSTVARPVAPLYAPDAEASIDNSIQSLKGRVDFDKVILAIPFYGYEWQTLNHDFRSPTVENTGALATYDRVTQLMKSRNDLEINWDSKSQTPWLIYEQNSAIKQIYFENEQSIGKKLNYIKQQKLAGVGIWAIGFEGDNNAFWEQISKFKK